MNLYASTVYKKFKSLSLKNCNFYLGFVRHVGGFLMKMVDVIALQKDA